MADPGRLSVVKKTTDINRDPVYPAGRSRRAMPWKATGSLGVALRAQPSDAALAVHPVIDIGFAGQAGDFPGLGARVLRHNIPVVV